MSVYDIIALTHPHLCTSLNRFYYRLMLPRTIRRADRIVVPSNHVRDRIEERFPGSSSRIRVAPLPLLEVIASARGATAAQPSRSDPFAEREYLLFVGDLGPKKNLDFLLRVYSLLPDEIRARYPLRVCGQARGRLEHYGQVANALGIGDRVIFGGYIPDAELATVYRKAALLLYPSLEEGYGYPPLEAMALGTPALVSDRGALPEIAGKAGAVVGPLDPHRFAGEIVRLLTDRSHYRQAQERGRQGVLRKTWIDYAKEMAEIYAEIL